MATRLLALALTLAFVLADCVATKPPEDLLPEEPMPLPSREIPWSMTGCDFAVVVLAVPAASVAPYVPAGFRIQTTAEVGLGGDTGESIPNPTEDGNFGIEVFQCAEGSGLNGTQAGVTYASFFTGVEPPAHLQRDVGNHFYKWAVLVPDEDRRALLQEYGVNATAGNVSVEVTATPLATVHTATMQFGNGTFTFDGVGAVPMEPGSFAEYTAVEGGFVEWSMNYTLIAGGIGPQTVVVPEGTFPAQVIGAGEFQGMGFSGRVDFTGGRILLPAGHAVPA